MRVSIYWRSSKCRRILLLVNMKFARMTCRDLFLAHSSRFFFFFQDQLINVVLWKKWLFVLRMRRNRKICVENLTEELSGYSSWTAWPQRLKKHHYSKRRYIFTQWQSITSQKTWAVNNVTVRTADLTENNNTFRRQIQTFRMLSRFSQSQESRSFVN